MNNFEQNNNLTKQKKQVKAMIYGIVAFFIGLFILISVLSSYFTIDAGDRGIVRRFGETVKVAEPGLHFKIPFFEDVVIISTREQKVSFGQYDERGDLTRGGFSAYSKDQQTVYSNITISFKVTDPIKVYDTFRTIDNMISQIVAPRLRNQLEITLSQYSAKDAIERRSELAQNLENNFKKSIEGYPIQVTSLQPVIQFNREYEKQIEASVQKNVEYDTAQRKKLIAQKEAETKLVVAQAEADAQIIQAKAEAEKVKLDAEAKAHAMKIQGLAEADALKAKNEALKDNQQLAVLKAAERWDGKLPVYMMPNSSMPFLQIPQAPVEK